MKELLLALFCILGIALGVAGFDEDALMIYVVFLVAWAVILINGRLRGHK
jgi:hypothetical protein